MHMWMCPLTTDTKKNGSVQGTSKRNESEFALSGTEVHPKWCTTDNSMVLLCYFGPPPNFTYEFFDAMPAWNKLDLNNGNKKNSWLKNLLQLTEGTWDTYAVKCSCSLARNVSGSHNMLFYVVFPVVKNVTAVDLLYDSHILLTTLCYAGTHTASYCRLVLHSELVVFAGSSF